MSEWVEDWLRRRPLIADTGVALLLFALDQLLQARSVFPALLAGALIFRRTRPVASAGAVVVIAFAQWLIVPERVLLVTDLAVPLVAHATAAYGPRWASRATLAAGLIGSGLGALTWPPAEAATLGSHVLFAAAMAAFVVTGWALGALHRVRAERIAALEAERDQKAQLAVAAERARIAREMHDVVAHSLAVVISQADGGRYAGSPEAAQSALVTIADTGRRAMSETRRLLGLLRDGPDPLTPQPGLAEIPTLVDRLRADGLPVDLRLDPPPAPIEGGLALAAYRIVQESLTNVVKHAGPAASATVAVRWSPHELQLHIIDDGHGDVGGMGTNGHGILGMRERAAAYGGTIRTGPGPRGGHEVFARLPLPT